MPFVQKHDDPLMGMGGIVGKSPTSARLGHRHQRFSSQKNEGTEN
jgi:hypothetical protein